jgi:hypothetical protein
MKAIEPLAADKRVSCVRGNNENVASRGIEHLGVEDVMTPSFRYYIDFIELLLVKAGLEIVFRERVNGAKPRENVIRLEKIFLRILYILDVDFVFHTNRPFF